MHDKHFMKISLKKIGFFSILYSLGRLGYHFGVHGLGPLGIETPKLLAKEGIKDLHWKALGDVLVRFFQHSGPVLTKIGQILSARDDLLPASICQRLTKLYDRQKPMPKKELMKIIKSEFGERDPFKSIETRPLGVGSIGQVHRAHLNDGKGVVIKVLRPNVREAIHKDMDFLRNIASFVFLDC